MYSVLPMTIPTSLCCLRVHSALLRDPSYPHTLGQIRITPSPKYPAKLLATPSFKNKCDDGNLKEAFQWLNILCTDSTWPEEGYASLLEICASTKAISQGRQLHARLLKTCPLDETGFLGGKLVLMYGKCGSSTGSEKVFDTMRERTTFAWNAMIGAYVSNGEPWAALRIYQEMRALGVPIDVYSFPILLKACGMLGDVPCGAEIHGLVVKLGYGSIVSVANGLISFYAKQGDLSAARQLFDRTEVEDDVVRWNSIISSYSALGKSFEALGLLREMQRSGPASNSYTFVSALRACGDSSYAKLGREIHAAMLKSGHLLEVCVCNALIAMYTRCGKMAEAGRILSQMDQKDVVSWNSLLVGFVQNCLHNEALELFRHMVAADQKPDEVSMTSVIAASGRLGNPLLGMQSHAYVIKVGLNSNLHVGNTLIDMYSKCGYTYYMGRAFYMMPHKDLISWTTVIAGYAQNNCNVEALELFQNFAKENIELDAMMLGSVLMSCRELKCMLQVKEIHCCILRKGLLDVVIQNAIVDVYGECGNIGYATRMFELMECKDVVSWTSMISSCAHNGRKNEALELFNHMLETGIEADSIALVCILSAAASLSALRKGKEIHGYLLRKGFCLEGSIGTALFDMYARCGDLENAKTVFDRIEGKGLVQYTSMVNAYGMHGQGEAAIELFTKMEHENVLPDHIAFLVLLYACSHAGLTEEGRTFLKIMEHKYKLEPWPEHYVCLVDMLGRANRVKEAYEFMKSMKSRPTSEVWCALLAACRAHSVKEIGEIAAQRLLELDPRNPGNLVLVSNVYAEHGRWKDVEAVRMKMKGNGLKKCPGCSWIEVGNKVHSFIARDKSHPATREIYEKLSEITRKLEREADYVAETKFVLHNVDVEEKVQMLNWHSERLAIAYGMLKTPEGARLLITKNLRVCGDCHTFCKLVSKLYRRELVMRDANRFHHFENGECSCRDFW